MVNKWGTKGENFQSYQDALIEDVFHWRHKMDFIKKEKEPTEVSIWDGKYIGFVNHFFLEKWPHRSVFWDQLEDYMAAI